ncbi:MAG: HD domain-containing protein [Candidatus Aenigmarchaeota archaeon]|nr:HD domain-containing protein [Candidatus Aenigmarchaeota archaeon]
MQERYFDVLEGTLMGLPEIQLGRGLWQNCHHCYDVYDHSRITGRNLIETGDGNLVAAGCLHDLGKPMTAMPVLTDEGYIELCPGVLCHTFPKHGEAGAYLLRKRKPELFEQLNLNQESVALLVEYHNTPLGIIKSLDASSQENLSDSLETAEKLLEGVPVDRMDLFQLFKADTVAKGKVCQDCTLLLKAAEFLSGNGSISRKDLYGSLNSSKIR